MERIRLSENFFLDEFTRSQTAERNGIDIHVEPGSWIFNNLQRLCLEVLQPTRDGLGGRSMFVTSGFRPPEVNRLVGSGDDSQHTKGEAGDVVVSGMSPYDVCAFIAASGLPFDQLIHEFGRWTHISIAPPGCRPRGEVLTAYRRDGRTRYSPGLLPLRFA